MGKKINPLIFRSQFKNKTINWVTSEPNYYKFIQEDKNIKDLILNCLEKKKIKLNSIFIFRKQTKIRNLINTLYILLLPSKNEYIEEFDFVSYLKGKIEKLFLKSNFSINLKLIKAEDEQMIVNHFNELAKTVELGGSIKLLLTRFLQDMSTINSIVGAKVEIYGRIEGSEKSRNLKLNYGPLNLQTFKSKIQYLTKRIETKDGTLNLIFTYKLR